MPKFTTICRTNDVPVGEGRMFVVGDVQVGVFHVGGEFLAIDNRCPHAGASLAHGNVEGETVSCRIHHWRFSLRDGERLDEACPSSNAKCYRVRIAGDEVQVELGVQ